MFSRSGKEGFYNGMYRHKRETKKTATKIRIFQVCTRTTEASPAFGIAQAGAHVVRHQALA